MASPSINGDPLAEFEAAEAEAKAAAQAANVAVTDAVSVEDATSVVTLASSIWGEATGARADTIRALEHAGAVVLLARRQDSKERELVGFAVGFLGWNRGLHLHSHQVGVVPTGRSTGAGYALKLAQRARCLAHGVGLMQWTYDPLMASNAKFNFARLGVQGTAFMQDFYGVMGDRINGSDRSDRFEVSWNLSSPLPQRMSPAAAAPIPDLVLEAQVDGWPHRRPAPLRPGAGVAIPPNYGSLREQGDPKARAWREALGLVLTQVFAAGLCVVDFRSGYYVLGPG
jgi:predicted GNAT superfamily acetyltransferase